MGRTIIINGADFSKFSISEVSDEYLTDSIPDLVGSYEGTNSVIYINTSINGISTYKSKIVGIEFNAKNNGSTLSVYKCKKNGEKTLIKNFATSTDDNKYIFNNPVDMELEEYIGLSINEDSGIPVIKQYSNSEMYAIKTDGNVVQINGQVIAFKKLYIL